VIKGKLMSSNFNQFKQQIDQVLSLVENVAAIKEMQEPQSSIEQLVDTKSLLNRCEQVCNKHQKQKPTIRIIHHFACSGGTLVSKFLSAMPNVFLLSEVHPHSGLQRNKDEAQYSPSDLAKLSIYAGIPDQEKLAEQIFVDSVKSIHQHIESRGGVLILRDHSHSDYCVGEHLHNNTVVELLKNDFNIISLVTLRNPIDSYLSLVTNGWVHFQPASFDEYCARLLAFLDNFDKDNVVCYEDVVSNPSTVVHRMCNKLSLPFDDTFESIFDVFSVTGDSGRKGVKILPRKRRDIPHEVCIQINGSKNYKFICENYPAIGL